MIDFIRTMSSRKARRGAVALEYALVLAFVAVAVLAALITVGTNLTTTIDKVGANVVTAGNEDFKK